MKSLLLSLLQLTILVSLTSCATMTAEKCQTTNWESAGFNDAMVAHSNQYDWYASKCQTFGVTPNRPLYTKGFEKGLVELCTFQNGYLIGNEGKALPRICPRESQDRFVSGFIQGESNYNQKKQIESQNQLMNKMIEESNKPAPAACTSSSQCGFGQTCSVGLCR